MKGNLHQKKVHDELGSHKVQLIIIRVVNLSMPGLNGVNPGTAELSF
jgi:hypothetical protein